MLWNLAQLIEARIIPLAADNNERGIIEFWPPDSSLGEVVQGIEEGRFQSLYLAGTLPPLGERRPGFVVVQDCYRGVNDRLADVVLPAASWAESEGTFVNVEGRVQKGKRLIEPLGESRPDWWIFCRLAEKMGGRDFGYKDTSEIAEEMSRTLPTLVEAFSHHPKKSRPAIVQEDRRPVSRLIPVDSPGGTGEMGSEAPAPEDWAGVPDYYRGLNLCQEIKGLRRLRERARLRGRGQEG